MKLYRLAFLLFLTLSTPLWAELNTKLKDNGGHHFQFEGSRYVITMNQNGDIYFMSKDLLKKDPKKAYEQRIRLVYGSSRIEGKLKKGYHFNEMETRINKKSSSFILTLQAKMENGVVVTSILEGSRSKVILKTQAEVPQDCTFWMSFRVPDAPEELEENGLLVQLSDKNKKITHRCNKPFETKHYRTNCRQILVQKRNPLSLIFDAGNAEGSFHVRQGSHNAGGVLNNNFTVGYSSKAQNWDAKKNTFVFSF